MIRKTSRHIKVGWKNFSRRQPQLRSFLFRKRDVKLQTLEDSDKAEARRAYTMSFVLFLGYALLVGAGLSVYNAHAEYLESLPIEIQRVKVEISALETEVFTLAQYRQALMDDQRTPETERFLIYTKLGMVAPNQVEIWD